jgi:type IV secretory pathway VirB10-like protein
MEEVELFLAPLTARSKVREVLRSLVATRQVHTIALGHAPHYYVAGTLPEFATAPTSYTSAAIPASSYFLRSYDHEEEMQPRQSAPAAPATAAAPAPESHPPRTAARKPAPIERAADRPRFSRAAARKQERKPAQNSKSGRDARRTSAEPRHGSARPGAAKRPSSAGLWSKKMASGANRSVKGRHAGSGSGKDARRVAGRGADARNREAVLNQRNGHRETRGNGHGNGMKATARVDAAARIGHKTMAAGVAKSRNGKRCGLTVSSRQGTKKRG